MPAIERDSFPFHYLDEGHPSGRPFVFQHGLGGGVPQPAGIESSPDIPNHDTPPEPSEADLSISAKRDNDTVV
jgi:hypothetical protein